MKHQSPISRNLIVHCLIAALFVSMNYSCSQDKNEQNTLDEKVSVEKIPVPAKNEEVKISFRELTAQELRDLAAKGISVVHDERAKTCKWSDDPNGSTYGEIECEGDCKVVACDPPSCVNPTICLGCFNPDLTHAGACRPR